MYIDILGTPYNIKFQTPQENPKLDIADANGLAELYSKELIIRTGYEDDPNSFNNVTEFREKVMRHEVIHAFFHECGLDIYSDDETLVNFLALQFPKLEAVMHKVHELHTEVIEGNKQCLREATQSTASAVDEDWDMK